MKKRVVIEVFGGVVQNVYADDEDIQFVMIDHDTDDPEDERTVFEGEDFYYLGVVQDMDKDVGRVNAIYEQSEELTKQEEEA